jgi:transcriptional regulator with XRE-family HTH domain
MSFSTIRVSDVKQAMGTLVKQLRSNRKLTQEQLAKQLNLSRITIQNLERGGNFTIETFLLVLQHFGEMEAMYDFIRAKEEDANNLKSFY